MSRGEPSERTESVLADLPAPRRPAGETAPAWVAGLRRRLAEDDVALPAIGYLILLTAAETLTVLVVAQLGLLLHFAVLILLLMHTAATWGRSIHRFLMSLAFVPLIRIISLTLPLVDFPLFTWYFITSVPLFVAAAVVMRQLGLPWRDAGLGGRRWGWQAFIAASGVLLGVVEYIILRPEPLVASFDLGQIWLPALILLFSTGYLEELIFRRIMQRAAVERLGPAWGIAYVALFFAVLHIGYRSVLDFAFVLAVGLVFGWLVQWTDNLVGVTLAHGLTNVFLFLVLPFWAPALGLEVQARVPAPVPAQVVSLPAVADQALAPALPTLPAPTQQKAPGWSARREVLPQRMPARAGAINAALRPP